MKDLGLVRNSPGWKKTWKRIEEFYMGLDGDDMEQFLLVNYFNFHKFTVKKSVFCSRFYFNNVYTKSNMEK
jgi:hypothetical protein